MSTLVDFEDIYSAIIETIKIPSTDGVTLARIKRDINSIYLNEVMTFKPRAWWWAELGAEVSTYEKITTGTIEVTADSTTVTFSSAPSVDLDGYYLKLSGYPDIVKITAHTAGQTTATIEKAWVNDTASGQDFKVWKDYAALPSNMKEVTIVTHDRKSTPLDAVSNAKFKETRARYPELEGAPMIYTTGDFDSDGNRIIRWYPSAWDSRVHLHISGVQEATALSAASDEPLMPVEDRIVLYYGALSLAWARERNESESNKCWNLFMQKLMQMAAKSGDAPQITELSVDRDYLQRKRYKRYGKRGYRYFTSD